jgi:hypothetical protein
MPGVPPTPHSARAGCSLCTIIAKSRIPAHSYPPSSSQTDVLSPVVPDSPWMSLSLNTPVQNSTSPMFPNSPQSPINLISRTTTTTIPYKHTADEREFVYLDKELTIWTARQEKGEALASGGRHLVVAFNAHAESIHDLVSFVSRLPCICDRRSAGLSDTLVTLSRTPVYFTGPFRRSLVTPDVQGRLRTLGQGVHDENRTKKYRFRRRCGP